MQTINVLMPPTIIANLQSLLLISHTKNQSISKTIAHGGTKNIYGVPCMKAAVHYITAIPILIFMKLKQTQQKMTPAKPQTVYDPYR